MFTMVLVIVLLSCGVLALRRKLPSNDDPPVLSGALPIIGHAHNLIGDSVKLWNYLKELSYECTKLGGVVTVLGPATSLYCVTDPEDFLTIANTCFQKNYIYKYAIPWIGNGLVTSDTPTWKVHRRLLNPAFSQSILSGFMDVFNGQARRLVTELQTEIDQGPFNHDDYIRKNALETTCLTVFGVDFTDKNTLSNEYVQAVEEIFEILIARIQNFWLYSDLIYSWSALKKKQDACLKILHNMPNTVMKNKKANCLNGIKRKNLEKKTMEEGELKCKTFMDLLLELASEKGAFTDQEIREHVNTMLFASHDTTANTLLFTMLLIGSYPKVQGQITEELYSVFSDDDRDVTKQDLTRLVYLEAVIKESIRIYPIAPIAGRNIDRNVKLRNCTLLKGKTCFFFIYGVHRHPMWGPDAEEFKPERWLDPTTLPKNPAAFAGFSLGKRNCIGKSYALISIKTTLAHIFRRYRVSGDHTKMVLRMDIVLKPVSGHHISIIERRKSKLLN